MSLEPDVDTGWVSLVVGAGLSAALKR